jgi:hypothetical protein
MIKEKVRSASKKISADKNSWITAWQYLLEKIVKKISILQLHFFR